LFRVEIEHLFRVEIEHLFEGVEELELRRKELKLRRNELRSKLEGAGIGAAMSWNRSCNELEPKLR
jgi:hypothetical protein